MKPQREVTLTKVKTWVWKLTFSVRSQFFEQICRLLYALQRGQTYGWCVWNVYILWTYIYSSTDHFQYVFVHAHPFGRGEAVLGCCHVVPAGCSSHGGGDRWTKFSFPVVYNSDRQREEQRAKEIEDYRERFNHWNGEEKKARCFKVEKIPKLEVLGQRDKGCASNMEWMKETEIDFLLVCLRRMWSNRGWN